MILAVCHVGIAIISNTLAVYELIPLGEAMSHDCVTFCPLQMHRLRSYSQADSLVQDIDFVNGLRLGLYST